MKRSQALTLTPLTLVILFAFTNCGDGFESVKESVSQASAACLDKLRNEPEAKVAAASCEIFSDYVCERRVFSPKVKTEKKILRECGVTDAAGELCVSVLIHSFDTSGARSLASEEEFLAGAEYNREEIQCSNSKLNRNGVNVIQAEGTNVFEALSLAIEKCRARGVK